MSTVRRFLAVVVIVMGTTACGGAGGRLPDGERSIDILVKKYVEAVTEGDTASMHRLRLSESQHNGVLWPELPASRPDFNMPLDFAWQNLERTSRREALRIVDEYQGRGIEALDVVCKKPVERYETLSVHGDCWVTVRVHSGARVEVKLFGSIAEIDGRYKIIGIVSG